MGRQEYGQIGYGFTLEEARKDAMRQARDYYGHQEGYSGSIIDSTKENPPKCLKQPKIKTLQN